jgi:hypothetical protein
MVQVCAAGIAAQSALPGALQHAEEWRVGGCGLRPSATRWTSRQQSERERPHSRC